MGPDRPGLVDRISGLLLEAGANIADSRMINLSGQFALVMLARTDSDDVEGLKQNLEQAGSATGLTVSVLTLGGGLEAPQAPEPPLSDNTAHTGFRLQVLGMDQPGIVHRITNLLHQQQVNIEEMQTDLQAGSYSQSPQFSMELRMSIPRQVQLDQLRGQLSSLCESLNCRLDMEPD